MDTLPAEIEICARIQYGLACGGGDLAPGARQGPTSDAAGVVYARQGPRYFLDTDDCYDMYVIPVEKRAEWEAWLNCEGVPAFARLVGDAVDGLFDLTFASPEIAKQPVDTPGARD